MVAAKAQASLRICADSLEPLSLVNAISTQISCYGPSMNIYIAVAIGIQGQVWCLIVSIPDLCPLSYLDET